MNRRFRCLIVTLVVGLAMGACGRGVGGGGTSILTAPRETATTQLSEGETTTTAELQALVVWTDEVRAQPIRDLAPAFTESTGIPVRVEVLGFQEIRERVTAAVLGGEDPDLFVGAHDWTGELVEAGVVRPFDLGGKRGDFLEVAIQAFTHGGTTFGVPYGAEAVGVFRNTDLAGGAPGSFAEVRAACDGLEDLEGCFGVPGGDPAEAAYYHYPFLSAYGGYVFAFEAGSFDPSRVGLDEPGAIDGGSFLASLVSDGTIGSADYASAKARFLEGAQPFWLAGLWEISELGQSAVSWEVSVVPTMEGNTPRPLVGVQGMFMSSGANQVVAQSFLLDVLATAEAMEALHAVDPRVPVYLPVLERVSGADQTLAAFARSVEAGEPLPNVPEMESVWVPLGEALVEIRAGEAEPGEALRGAADRIRQAVEAGG